MGEQWGGELAPDLSTTGTRDATPSANAKSAEIRGRSSFRLQPLQSRTQILQPGHLQDQSIRRPRRAASARRDVTGIPSVHLETGCHLPDATATDDRPIPPRREVAEILRAFRPSLASASFEESHRRKCLAPDSRNRFEGSSVVARFSPMLLIWEVMRSISFEPVSVRLAGRDPAREIKCLVR